MEDEKNKKKRNKKKKKNKNKAAAEEDATVSNWQNDHQGRVPEAAEVQNGGDADSERHYSDGIETDILVEAEKQLRVERVTALQDTIKQLRNENDSDGQTQITLQERIKQLEDETVSHVQKEASLEEKLDRLLGEKAALVLNVESLKENVMQLESQEIYWTQTEESLKEKVMQLESQKIYSTQTEESLNEKVRQLESQKIYWTQTEDRNKETVAKMNVDITKLRMQVVELKESRNGLLKENQELIECTSNLQLRLQNLETNISTTVNPEEFGKPGPEYEDLNLQIEASLRMVDRLITENAELAEKVNELNIKLEQQSPAPGLSSTTESGGMNGDSGLPNGAIPLSRSIENFPVSDHTSRPLEVEPSVPPYASETHSGEIMQIRLDAEARNLQLQVVESDEMEKVTLSDAPLIGAPFRLISFFANYVSGADLVNKDAVNLEP